MNTQINNIVAEVLDTHNSSVKAAHARHLVSIMSKDFRFFKSAFINLVDKILVLEEKDLMIKNLYSLLAKFFAELARVQAQLNQGKSCSFSLTLIADVNSLLSALLNHLISTYFLPKCPYPVLSRCAFIIAELSNHYGGLSKIKLESSDKKLLIQDLVIDLFHSNRATLIIYGIQIACEMCNQSNTHDQLYIHLMKTMTHHSSRDVRRACIQHLRAPFSQISLVMLGKRLRDKDDEIRRQAYLKLARCKITIESFPAKEQRMLIIKEGLTDQHPGVMEACFKFLRPTLTLLSEEEMGEDEAKITLIEDMSLLFKIIDCKQMFIKEYYIQLPFIIMRFIFTLASDDDTLVSRYMEKILVKLRAKSGLLERMGTDDEPLTFEELLFLRIAYEYTKMYRHERSAEFIDHLDRISLSFDDYAHIFEYLLTSEEGRLVFSEWVKFSL